MTITYTKTMVTIIDDNGIQHDVCRETWGWVMGKCDQSETQALAYIQALERLHAGK
jgi:hypothetical protein